MIQVLAFLLAAAGFLTFAAVVLSEFRSAERQTAQAIALSAASALALCAWLVQFAFV